MVKDFVTWGAGPRASQYLILAAKTRCLFEGRFTPDIHDVKKVALPVLRHRLIISFNAEADGVKQDTIITKLSPIDFFYEKDDSAPFRTLGSRQRKKTV